MPDDVVGSARIRIEPDFTGFDAALEAGVAQAADQAAEAIVTAFRAAAQSSAAELSEIGQAGFVDVTATADTAAQDLEAAFAAAASEADAALGTIGSGAGEQIAAEFTGTGEEIAATLGAGATEADAALSGIGAGAGEEVVAEFSGAGDAIAAEFSGVGDTIASDVGSGTSQATSSLSELESTGSGVADNLGSAFEGLGGIIAAAAGAFALGSFFNMAERIQSIAGVTTTLLETTGNVAGITADEIVGLGDSIEGLTGIESELVQEASNVLLTFKNVRNEVGEGNDIFNRAIRAGSDLSAVLGGDMSGSALQLGKALQDPIKGLTVLGRAGVTFTEDQKALVRSLVEEGDLLSAQKVILDELEGQVGGAAAASVKATDQIRNAIGRVTDEIGAGLLPAADDLARRLPAIVDDLVPVGTELGEALGSGALLAVDALLALTPLLGVTTDLLVLLLPILETAVGVIDAIPDPVLNVAASVFLVNKALAATRLAIAASGLLGLGGVLARVAVPAGAVSGAFTGAATASVGLRGGLSALIAGLNPVTVGIAGVAASVVLYNKVIGDAEDEGKAFAQSVRDGFDPATASLDELVQASADLDTKIGDLQGSVDDSFWGRNTVNRDFNAALNEGVEGLQAFQVEIDAAIVEQRRMEVEAKFGAVADELVGVADAMAFVRSESSASASAISELRHTGDLSAETFLGVATALGDAALSEEAMAEAARLLGTDVETLTAFITNVNEALTGFIDTALTGLPEIAGAFRDSNDDAKVSAREFITGLNEDALELATFFGDIKTITEAGFAEVAGTLAEQGADVAGAATHELAEAARKGNVELLLRTQEGLNARDTAIANSTDYLERVLGPEFVLANGTVAREATEAFGANFDPAEQVRIAGELAASGLDEQGQRIAAIAATQGSRAAREFGAGLNMDDAAIAAAVAAGEAIRANAPTEAARTAGDETGAAFGDGMIYGIRRKELEAAFAAQGLVGAALIAARKLAGINSPSTVWAEMGAFMGEGLALGLEESGRQVVAVAEEIVRAAAAAASEVPIIPRVSLDAPALVTAAAAASASTAASSGLSAFGAFGGDSGGGVTIDARDWHVEGPDPLATAEAVIARLRAEVFLQRRS